jgi:hypothetical protein
VGVAVTFWTYTGGTRLASRPSHLLYCLRILVASIRFGQLLWECLKNAVTVYSSIITYLSLMITVHLLRHFFVSSVKNTLKIIQSPVFVIQEIAFILNFTVTSHSIASIGVVSNYSETPLQRHQFIQHLIYCVRYSVISVNSSLLTITLYYSVITTLVYNNTKYSVPLMTL